MPNVSLLAALSIALVVVPAVMVARRSAAQRPDVPPNTLSENERSAGWRLLFDGTTTTGWHGYGRADFPLGWKVVDGTLTLVAPAGDIVTDARFGSFELAAEWRIEPGGNSGIFYRGLEDPDPASHPLFETAPEMQVLDDARHADGKSPLTSAGSNFGLYPARRGVVRPAGQWNQARIVVKGNQVEHWLNGTRVVAYELDSPDWKERVANSKFAKWPKYGKLAEGVIGLQDHGDRVSYRNLKIRALDKS
jgi:hypothetical protein